MKWCLVLFVLILSGCSTPKSMADFDLIQLKSPIDFDQDKMDDYADFLLGAKKDAQNKPRYDGSYVVGGYPEDHVGVCTDVIWRAFKEAGYSLKEMVDNDIRSNPDQYPSISAADPNIDFRRVPNLELFFSRYALKLTTDINKLEEWQPGDIVIFNHGSHIGMISDLRNDQGQAYVIHNAGQFNREEDYLNRARIDAHYRFDASIINPEILIPWQ